MVAYVIVLRESPIRDQAEMDAYHGKIMQNPVDPKLKMLALYGAIDAVEGEPADGVVLLEFPTVADARAWYDGPYKEAAQHRMRAADHRLMIVEGV